MKLAYFSGCKIPYYLTDYDLSFRAVMNRLGVELVEPGFNCCGNPARNENFEISILSSIKNLAVAEKAGLDILTPCKCCFGQFKHAIHWYRTQPHLKQQIDRLLADEGLFWTGRTRVSHLLNFLHQDVGLERLKASIKRLLAPRKVAVQYGCHALRPFSITGFDNPFFPTLFEQLLTLTGVLPVDWSKRTECCGDPIWEGQPELSAKLLKGKLDAAETAGADYICSACTHCQIQYERIGTQIEMPAPQVRSVLFTQILGAALGIAQTDLSAEGKLPADLF